MTTPLDGLLVADFSRVLAGPLATMHLADLGATVVKVERPGVGDETRSWGPPWLADPEAAPGSASPTAAYFGCVNRGKYSVSLDLADEADRAAARELARRADVLVENFRPGSLGRHGLHYDAVAATNPGVVYCSISGFGPALGAGLPGYDFIVQAVGGLMSITGEADGEPTKVGVALVDVLTGKDAVIGILAALQARAATGRGEHVEVDLMSSLLGGLVNQAAAYLATGVPPTRMGNRHPSIAPYETLRCADGPLAVGCGNDAQFGRLAGVLGRPDLRADARFGTNAARVAHREALVAELEGALAARPAPEWERLLTAAGVPAGLVGDVGQALDRAERLGLHPLVAVGDRGEVQVRHPVRYRNAALAEPAAPPRLGADSAAIRSWLRDGGALPPPRRGPAR